MDISELERMSRRRFMENLGGIGVSATTLNYLEQAELAEVTHDPEKDVPYVERIKNIEKEPGKPPKREPIYNTIPREEWERRHATLSVKDQIGELVQDNFSDYAVTVGFGGSKHSPTDFAAKVLVDENEDLSLEDLESVLPKEATGTINGNSYEEIPIIISERPSQTFASYQFNDFDPVPGGQRLAVDTPEIAAGTIMGTFHSDAYGDGLATAGHVLQADGNFVTEVISSSQDMEALGYSRDVKAENKSDYIDCGFIDMSSVNQNPTDSITSSDNSYIEFNIDGFYTDEALDYHAGEDNTLKAEMQGATSGRKSGYVRDTMGLSDTKAVAVDALMDDGDSGGPIFNAVDSTSAYLLGNISGPYLSNMTEGTTIETMEEELGGYAY